MTARYDLDRHLADWMTETVSSPPPAGRFEQAMEATARRRPRPGWLAVFGSKWVGMTAPRRAGLAWPGPSRELVTALLVALLVAAAIVGAALVGAHLRRPDPWPFGSLAYSVDGDIYVASSDGGPPSLVADGWPDPGPHHYWDPHWSPDRRYLMYQDSNATTQAVHVVDLLGQPVATFPGWYSTWAPDSSRIATWNEPVSDNVEVFALDGRVLASDVIPPGMQGSGDQRPGWSPDGSAIVLPRYRFGAGSGVEPWVLPLDGAAPRPLSVEAKGYRPAFSPDGTRIAIDTEAGLILTAADGTGAQMLLTGPGSWPFVKPLWSPDGTRIAVSYKEGGTAPLSTGILPESIQVVNVATGATVTIHTSSGREVTAVDWSTDGRAVLVVQGDGNVDTGQASVWSVPADGSGGHLVVERAYFEGPDWR